MTLKYKMWKRKCYEMTSNKWKVLFLSLLLTVDSQTYRQAYPESLVDVVYQSEQLYKVIHGDSDDGRAECGGGEGDEDALPLKSEDGK